MIRILAPVLPYLAVAIGLYALRSTWAAIGLYHAGIVLYLVNDRPRIRPATLLRGGSIPWTLALGIGAILTGPVLYLLWDGISLEPGILPRRLEELGLGGAGLFAFALYFPLIGSLLEELYWRGALGSPARHPIGRDAAFAGYHLLVLGFFVKPFALAIVFVTLTIVAWIWRVIATERGGLAVPAIVHLLADASVILALFWLL